MAKGKSVRLIHLTILLLSARRYISKESIRRAVEGYQDMTDISFERTFERDKDELRALGVPIETGSNSALFDDEVGYRIRRQDFELPAVEFTPDEAKVLSVASGVWQQTRIAEQASGALTKLRASGISLDAARLGTLSPHINAREPAFDALWEALTQRRQVRFTYRDCAEVRVVQPWLLALRSNSWYMLGYDTSRAGQRLFKLARISSPLKLGPAGAYQIPDDVDGTDLTQRFGVPGVETELVVAIRERRAPALRRSAEPARVNVTLPQGYAAWRVRLPLRGLVEELSSFGPDVIVLEPEAVRAAVLAHLHDVVATQQPKQSQP